MSTSEQDPFTGTWVFSGARSVLSTPLPQSWVLHIIASATDVSHREEIVASDGSEFTVVLHATFDGKDYAVSGSPLMDTIACTRPGSHVIASTGKQAGAVTLTDTLTAAPDGNVLTLNYSIFDGRQEVAKGTGIFELKGAAIQHLHFRPAVESDFEEMADAHRDSIFQLGSRHYANAIVNEWAGGVNPMLYLNAMNRGEVFFVATGTVAGGPKVLGFSSDYVIAGTTHGASAYVRPAAARRRVGSRLLGLAESFGRSRGATEVQIEAALGAFDFYKHHGFVETTRGCVTLPSGIQMPCVFMRKVLR